MAITNRIIIALLRQERDRINAAGGRGGVLRLLEISLEIERRILSGSGGGGPSLSA